jgi:hypothetical protein
VGEGRGTRPFNQNQRIPSRRLPRQALPHFRLSNAVTPMNLQNKPIAIIGLGYVGLPLAVKFYKHRDTLGFDINHARIAELQSGKDYTLECSTEELQAATHLRYSANLPVQYAAIVLAVGAPQIYGHRRRGPESLGPTRRCDYDVKSILPLGVADGRF